MEKFTKTNSERYIKSSSDAQVAQLGHLNKIVENINELSGLQQYIEGELTPAQVLDLANTPVNILETSYPYVIHVVKGIAYANWDETYDMYTITGDADQCDILFDGYTGGIRIQNNLLVQGNQPSWASLSQSYQKQLTLGSETATYAWSTPINDFPFDYVGFRGFWSSITATGPNPSPLRYKLWYQLISIK